MPNTMSSRQRMLAALDCQEPDHTPCAFMLFNALRDRSQSYTEFVERQVEMGLMEILAPGGGFILSPVDNVRENSLCAQQNVEALIDEWRRLSAQ